MNDCKSYPLRYALETVNSKDGAILEAGCGAGRILRYYHDLEYDIRDLILLKLLSKNSKKWIPH